MRIEAIDEAHADTRQEKPQRWECGDFDLDGRTAVILLFEALKEGNLNFFEPGSIDGDILYLLIFYLLDLDYIR